METCVKGGFIPIKYKLEDVCPLCMGKGCQPDQYIKCHCCCGRGTVNITKNNNLTNNTTGICPECSGNRYIYQSICLKCKGNGKISIKRKLNVKKYLKYYINNSIG